MVSKKTLVFGASLKPERYSNLAIRKLVHHKLEVVAFGLRKGKVAEVIIDTELKPYKKIHTISLYINPKRQEEYYNYLISLQPKRIIFNPGTENPDFFNLLQEQEIFFEVACTLVLLSTNQY